MKRAALAGLVLILGGALVWLVVDGSTSTADAEAVHDQAQGGLDRVVTPSFTDAGVRGLSGVVLDAQGQPAAAVKVTVTVQRPPREALVTCHECGTSALECPEPETKAELLTLLRDPSFAAQRLTDEVLTDAAGRFQFAATLPNVALHLVARAPDKATAIGTVNPEQVGEVELVLVAPTAFSFGVTFADPEVTAPAQVFAYDFETDDHWEGTTVDRFEVSTAAASLWVSVSSAVSSAIATDVARDAELFLPEHVALSVSTVRGARPIEAEVTMTPLEPGRGHVHRAKTVNGVASFGQFAPATGYSVAARAGALSSAPVDFYSDRSTLTLELAVTGRLLVSLVDPQGNPAPPTRVELTKGVEPIASSMVSKGDGALVVYEVVPVGAYQLSASDEPTEEPTEETAPPENDPLKGPPPVIVGSRAVVRSIEIGPGDNHVEIVMAPKPLLRGRVLRADGTPESGAKIDVLDEALGLSFELPGWSAADGTFTMPAREAGVWVVRVSSLKGSVDARLTTGAPPVDLRLDSKGCIEVSVTDEAGVPLEAAVRVIDRFDQEVTDERGRLTFCGIGAETVDVAVDAKDEAFLDASGSAQGKPGTTVALSISLARAAIVSGSVVDEQGAPLKYAAIVLDDEGVVASTDTDGLFETKMVKAGKQPHVRASLDGYEEGVLADVVLPVTGLQFRLKRLPHMSGRVRGSDGSVIKSFNANGENIQDEAGRFTVPFNPRLGLFAENYDSVELEVDAGQLELGEIVMPACGKVSGVVIDAEGKPVEGASLTVGSMPQPTATNARGEFELPVLAAEAIDGGVEISASLRQFRGTADARIGGSVTITLSAPTKVIGRVLGPDGKGREARINVESHLTSTIEVESAADGQFTLELSRGRYLFTTRLGYSTKVVDIEGATQEVVLGVPPGSCGVVVDFPDVPDSTHAYRLVPSPTPAAAIEDVIEGAGTIYLGYSGRAEGITCGGYIVLGSFVNGYAMQWFDVRGPQTHVSVKPPEDLDAVPKYPREGETTPGAVDEGAVSGQ